MANEPGNLDFNLLLGEVESGSSGSIASVVRKLREHESQAYSSGSGGPIGELVARFGDALLARAEERDIEIEKTCSHNYQSFVESTSELLGIQNDAILMQNDLKGFSNDLDKAVTQFTESCKELSECRVSLELVDQCIEALNICLPFLDEYLRVEQSFSDGRLFHALRTLQDLEHSHFDQIRPYAFSVVLCKRIHEMRKEIKEASLEEVTHFLEEIRKHSVRLGTMAMHETALATGMDSQSLLGNIVSAKEQKQTEPTRDSNPFNSDKNSDGTSPRYSGGGLSVVELDRELEEFDQLFSNEQRNTSDSADASAGGGSGFIRTEDLINFGPIYRCIHIHSMLNERSEFERYYCTQRRKQFQLSLSVSRDQQINTRNYGELFGGICGFFVVDDFLRRTLPDASTQFQNYLDELWNGTLHRMIEFARMNAGSCDSLQDLLRLKDYSILFERTMQRLGFSTIGLVDMISWTQRRYQTLITNQWRERFTQIIHDDRFVPLEIESETRLNKLLNLYPHCNTAEYEALPFPRQFCFSWMVPQIYAALKEYVDVCNLFCEHMVLAQNELEDMVNRSVNNMFSTCLCAVLNQDVTVSEQFMPRLVQYCINLEELESACGYLDTYLSETTGVSDESVTDSRVRQQSKPSMEQNDGIDSYAAPSFRIGMDAPRSRLQGASLLKDIRALVERFIYDHLNKRIEDFVNLICYDQMRSTGSNDETIGLRPSEHIVDLTEWLTTTFQSFTNLPPKVSQTACLTVCKHLSRCLSNIVTGPQVRELSDLCMLQLSVDLSQCEAFARSQPVPGLDPNLLILIFADLRQLLDLYHKDDWNTYLAGLKRIGATDPYNRVTRNSAIKLLEGSRNALKKRVGFLISNRVDKARLKMIDDVLKQLKT